MIEGELPDDIPYPNPLPHLDLTVAMTLWNEAERLPALLDVVQAAAGHTTIVVQESSDDTLWIAINRRRESDTVIEDDWRGTGDASMPLLLSEVKTPWVLVLAGDEMPSRSLLESLWSAAAWAEREGVDGLWLPFHSTIEGVGYEEQHGHLRMFKSELGWPNTMHSRPMPHKEAWWPIGHIDHDRSIDEFAIDYLRYLSMSGGNTQWIAHNKLMLRSACEGVAAVKGWDFIKAFEWWPKVQAAVFSTQEVPSS